MGAVADDPYWLERWLLPDVVREGEVFETMLEAVEDRLQSVQTAWKEMQDEPGWPDGAEDSLAEEGTSALAMRIDIAEIALTAVFHWIERRCTLVLLQKAAAKHDEAQTVEKLARASFEAKMNALTARGVDVENQPHFALINGVLREFANSWKHRDRPKRELLTALGLDEDRQTLDLLEDDAVREAMAGEVGIPGRCQARRDRAGVRARSGSLPQGHVPGGLPAPRPVSGGTASVQGRGARSPPPWRGRSLLQNLSTDGG